jgi:hypothetical protein
LIIWWVKSKMSLENPIFQRSIIGFYGKSDIAAESFETSFGQVQEASPPERREIPSSQNCEKLRISMISMMNDILCTMMNVILFHLIMDLLWWIHYYPWGFP